MRDMPGVYPQARSTCKPRREPGFPAASPSGSPTGAVRRVGSRRRCAPPRRSLLRAETSRRKGLATGRRAPSGVGRGPGAGRPGLPGAASGTWSGRLTVAESGPVRGPLTVFGATPIIEFPVKVSLRSAFTQRTPIRVPRTVPARSSCDAFRLATGMRFVAGLEFGHVGSIHSYTPPGRDRVFRAGSANEPGELNSVP